jgi:hypothetical protein
MTQIEARPTAYEQLVPASDLEAAIRAQLVKWMPSYLWEIQRQQGDDPVAIAIPNSYVVTTDVSHMPEEQLPSILIATVGTTDPPMADGQGRYTVRWRVTVAALVAARGNRVALRLARLYAAGMRGVLIQQQALEGVSVRRIEWEGERYDTLDSINDRTICVAELSIIVEVSDVVTRHAGPLVPWIEPEEVPDPESPVWYTATDVDITIDKAPLEEELDG